MFESILFSEPVSGPVCPPDCLSDLRLDRVFDRFLNREENRNLAGWFYTPLKDEAVVRSRQAVFRDLKLPGLGEALTGFSRQIGELSILAKSDSAPGGRELTRGRILRDAEQYSAALEQLNTLLADFPLRSPGLRDFRAYLNTCVSGPAFTGFREETAALRREFDSLNYCMLIRGRTVRVRKYDREESLTEEVRRCFEKFSGPPEKKDRPEPAGAEHVEGQLLRCLSGVYPKEFSHLERFCSGAASFYDRKILRFAKEIRFYLVWISCIGPVWAAGLPFCCPEISDSGCRVCAEGVYDLALAQKTGGKIVTNDFALNAPERMIVVTGPGRGGKTTFARAVGSLHYLASLGLPVPARSASLLLTDGIYCHFPRPENLSSLSGKLQEELERLKSQLDSAGPGSLMIINDIFTSTTPEDAVMLCGRMMDRIAASGAEAVIVTCIEEAAKYGPEAVSMRSCSDSGEPFRIRRSLPDSRADARSEARRYGLTYEQLMERIAE